MQINCPYMKNLLQQTLRSNGKVIDAIYFSWQRRRPWIPAFKRGQGRIMKMYKSGPMIQYGTVLKEYVVIPDRLLNSPKELKKYFELSYAYAKTLNTKATSKTMASKKKNK